MTAKTATPVQYAGDMLEKALSDRARLIEALKKSIQYTEQLASMVNTLKPKGVHSEDFTEHASNLLRELEGK